MNETVCYGCEYSDIQVVTKTLNDIGISDDMISAMIIISIITLIVLIVWYKIIPALPMKR